MARHTLLAIIVLLTFAGNLNSVTTTGDESSKCRLPISKACSSVCPEGAKPESRDDDDLSLLQSVVNILRGFSSNEEPEDSVFADAQESKFDDLYVTQAQRLPDSPVQSLSALAQFAANSKVLSDKAQRLPDSAVQSLNDLTQIEANSNVFSDKAALEAVHVLEQAANSMTYSARAASEAAEVLIHRHKGVSTERKDGTLAWDPVQNTPLQNTSTTKMTSAANASNASASKRPTAAEATGVSTNVEGDLEVFLAALAVNSATIFFALIFFLVARRQCPIVYEGLVIENIAPRMQVAKGICDWAISSYKVTIDQVQDSVGLDMAGLLMFTNMCIRTFAILCVPLLFIEGPLNYVYGGNAAGKDHLSYLSFGNVETGSWLYNVHSGTVWLVAFIVQWNVYTFMGKFMRQRFRWLRELPFNRSCTVLVQDIPDEYQSDAALKLFFEKMFGEGSVKSAACVKVCPELTQAIEEREAATKALETAKSDYRRKADPKTEAKIREIRSALIAVDQRVKYERTRVYAQANRTDGINAHSGFVTFHSRNTAELAQVAVYSPDVDDWEVSKAPPAVAIQWEVLKGGSRARKFKFVLGYLLVALLYVGYLPAVVYITQLANRFHMGVFQPIWGALAPTMGLNIMVAMLPTFLITIFSLCLSLPDAAMAQQYLQNWYFVFQLVFVVMVTAIGGSIMQFMETIVENPLGIFTLLGQTMPGATHFYMNFIVLQWVTHFTNLTRNVNLIKYGLFRWSYDAAKAKEMCEPEDQDYYGIGSRSARFTINACVGIVYGTLSPPITFLTLINFLICRLVYGYLCVFAETKKPDMGGSFFVHQLKHLFVGNAIYCITMTGVLLGRSKSKIPGLVAGASLVYILFSYHRFNQKYNWEKIPLAQVPKVIQKTKSGSGFLTSPVDAHDSDDAHDSYVQPELSEKDGLEEDSQVARGFPAPKLSCCEFPGNALNAEFGAFVNRRYDTRDVC